MILYLIPILTGHITFIINKCLVNGECPEIWKEATITPIPKITNPKNPNDFRPISILPTLSKVLEKVVHLQLNQYLNENKILPITQSGFRPQHSTTTALLKVTDDIFCACDKGKKPVLVLLDYTKGFDTIDHTMMEPKLKYFGMGNAALKFFNSYFSNRKQRVNFNKSLNFKPFLEEFPKEAYWAQSCFLCIHLIFVLI